MKRRIAAPLLVSLIVTAFTAIYTAAADDGPLSAAMKKWQAGQGWGWVWGDDDEVGSLNEMTDASRLAAVRLVERGRVYDLGVLYDRTSFKWPGHNPAEIMSFRTPEGEKRQGDEVAVKMSSRGTAWHSCALFISDNVGTQIDSLGHATEGDDNHWYNGFREEDWGGDWGPRKCDASTIPPIVARGVMIDVAGFKELEALPPHYAIGAAELQAALDKQGTRLRPGDVVLIRTGAMRYWNETGADHQKLAEYDSAGLTLEAARWLVEQQGAMLIGSDTSGLEYKPPMLRFAGYMKKYGSFMPVHNYLLIEQGVHIGEFHYLEDLAADGVYEFCYMCTTNKIKGTTAGFTLRPIALK